MRLTTTHQYATRCVCLNKDVSTGKQLFYTWKPAITVLQQKLLGEVVFSLKNHVIGMGTKELTNG